MGQFAVGQLRVHLQQEMQTCILLQNRKFVRKGTVFQQGNHPIPAIPVEISHPVDMLFKMAPTQKTGQRILLKGRHGAAVKTQFFLKISHQSIRQHHIADTDGGGQGLGEGVHVYHPAVAVQGLHGGNGVGVESEFRVVIILDNVSIFVICPPEQRFSAADGGYQTGGKMVGGGNVEHRCVFQRIRPDTLHIHGGADAGNTAGGIDFSDFSVTRLFHRVDPIPAEKLDQQIVKKVSTGADEDVFRIHMHTPEGGQMIGDGLPQLRNAPVGNGQQQFFTVIQHHFPLEFAPNREGEPDGAVAGKVQQGNILRIVSGSGRGNLCRGDSVHGFHEVADFFPGADVPFCQQLIVGGFHGDFADFQIFCQGSFGGQLFSGRQGAV